MSPDELAVLQAERAITTVLHRYCRSMDRIDAALGYTVWHEGGLADYGHLFQGTGREFIDWVCGFHRDLDATSHQIASTLIAVDGDQAGSETYVTVGLLGRTAGRQTLTTGRGRYVDRWSRRGGVWAIDRRRYIHDFDFTTEVEARIGWGTRDPADPSYDVLGSLGAA